ncbi:MAG: hypothetical protein SGJ00_01960 [bacterium]|nr:hypothetical protein [bacterium]
MDDRENLENLALKKSILPVLVYLLICSAVFFLIDQTSLSANHFLGNENLKLVNVLKGIVIGLLTTFLIFFLFYKYKYVEINALRNMHKMVLASPYPMALLHYKDQSVMACSNAFSRLLGYTSNETIQLTLSDILTEIAFKKLMEQKKINTTINHDFADLHLVQKNKQALSLAVNVMNFELLDKEYLIISCHSAISAPKTLSGKEENQAQANNQRKFQF